MSMQSLYPVHLFGPVRLFIFWKVSTHRDYDAYVYVPDCRDENYFEMKRLNSKFWNWIENQSFFSKKDKIWMNIG